MRRAQRETCRMRPPDDLLTPDGDTGGALLRDPPEKYTHFRLRQTHDRIVSSAQAPTDEYMGAVVASQFPSRCDRLLLIEDDLAGQGLGVTAHYLAIALLNAMRTGRVLLEVTVNPRWGPTNISIPYRQASAGASTPTLPSARPRWCSRPPYTHQCFYQPWSNCTAGNTSLHQSPRLGRWNGLPGHALLPGGTPIVRIKLSGLYITPHHARVMGPAYGAAMRFLFRPREWVKHLGRCVLRRDGLVPRSFISVFIRHSVEKSTETRRFRYKMPVKYTAMPVCPIHHWGYTEAAVNDLFYLILRHNDYISGLKTNANLQPTSRVQEVTQITEHQKDYGPPHHKRKQ